MKKNWIKYLLPMGAFILCVASCKDDDHEPSEQEKERQMEQEIDQAAEFWNVVGQLTDDVMPDDWQNATYAPSIGEPDGANSSVRIISCADEESAAERFADLVGLAFGKEITAETAVYTYTSPVVGTLHYQKTGGTSLATVDVDIKQMPGLSQIIYKTPEQLGDNGNFSGTAYYRFGDVVAKANTDGQTDYWICVRPCFGPEGKGDSHWITLSKIPAANTKSASKTVNGVRLNHLLPKSLATNTTHMQNLAELLYAMTNPDTWAANLRTGYTRLKYFTDFKYTQNYKYHNQYFFENVGESWPEGLYKAIFGITKEQLEQELSTNGLNLIYSSATMSGNNISLPVASFSGTNLKTKLLSKKTTTWTTESFNIYDLMDNGYAEFTNVAGRKEKVWTARYATGATLAKGGDENPVFDKYKRLPNCNDVFVYNIEVDNLNLDNLKNIAPKQAAEGDRDDVASKARDDSGTYMIGDVLADDFDNRWFCIAGSPCAPINPGVTDKTAYFISFDFNDKNINGSKVEDLPDEDEVIEAARMLNHFFVGTFSVGIGKYVPGTNGNIGVILRHILTYADVDMRVATTAVDSTWTFTSGGNTFNSKSSSIISNIAYDDGSFIRQAVLRTVFDMTQAGSFRNSCDAASGKTYRDWQFQYYKHYQTSALPRMRQATADEISLGMNEWCLPWAMTEDKMYLDDVADAGMVASHAADDKWVRLPFVTGVPEMTNARRTARTQPERSARPSDYIGKYDTYDTPKTNIYNEPVMFFRMMKVTDNGGKKPNLTSQDGRELHIIHLQNNADLYNGFCQAIWAQTYNQGRNAFHFVDNVLTPMPKTPGWNDSYFN